MSEDGWQSPARFGQLSLLQVAVLLIGVLFLALGLLGSLPGVTCRYGELHWAGEGSTAELFGVFTVSVGHNAVHLASGIAAIAMSGTAVRARCCLLGVGLLYLALWVSGLLVNSRVATNFLPVDLADTWLHLCLGIVMTGLAAVLPWPSQYLGGAADRVSAVERR